MTEKEILEHNLAAAKNLNIKNLPIILVENIDEVIAKIENNTSLVTALAT